MCVMARLFIAIYILFSLKLNCLCIRGFGSKLFNLLVKKEKEWKYFFKKTEVYDFLSGFELFYDLTKPKTLKKQEFLVTPIL